VVSAASCPGGTLACGASASCCPTGTTCVANPDDVYGCGADVCCLGCAGGGVGCGGGCCASGTSCVSNPGGATSCGGGNLCCSPTPDPDPCPANVAAACPGGTKCLKNHSARYCSGGYACYQASGAVACPGEVMCPDQASFCPAGKFCGAPNGVCTGSAGAGNYCCFDAAQAGQSCDYRPCADGLTCMHNAHCGGEEPGAVNVCRTGTCGGSYPVNCGNFCCSSSFPACGDPDTCMCWQF
jgi:hypothetical protein